MILLTYKIDVHPPATIVTRKCQWVSLRSGDGLET
jgi:hypothetical protein